MYWAHIEDRSVELEETLGAFARLVERGMVGSIGVSNHPTWRVERARALSDAHSWPRYTALQLSTSYVRQRPDTKVPGKDHRFAWVTDETIDYVQTHPEIEIWAYSPLIGGSYDRADRPLPEVYDHPGTTRRLEALDRVATELGATRNQIVLAWLTNSSPQILPIIGASSIPQLDEALAAPTLPYTPSHHTHLTSAT